MVKKYLFLANDVWFDFEQLVKDTKGNFWWFQSPKSVAIGERVYMYQSGGTKAIKYEFEVINTKKKFSELPDTYERYVKQIKNAPINRPLDDTLMCELKLIRQIKSIEMTSPKNLKEKGNLLGSLMSQRTLRPLTIAYLDKLK